MIKQLHVPPDSVEQNLPNIINATVLMYVSVCTAKKSEGAALSLDGFRPKIDYVLKNKNIYLLTRK